MIMAKPRGKTSLNTPWFKFCPDCGNKQFYSSQDNLNKSITANRKCMRCKNNNENREEWRQKISNSLKGRKFPNKKLRSKQTQKSDFF